jgi:hypothetical protein
MASLSGGLEATSQQQTLDRKQPRHYNVQALNDGVVVMKRTTNREADHNLKLENALDDLLAAPLPNDPKRRSKP